MATVQEKTECLADIPVEKKKSSCGTFSIKTIGGNKHQSQNSTGWIVVGDSIKSSQRSAMKGGSPWVSISTLTFKARWNTINLQWKGTEIYAVRVKSMEKTGQRWSEFQLASQTSWALFHIQHNRAISQPDPLVTFLPRTSYFEDYYYFEVWIY